MTERDERVRLVQQEMAEEADYVAAQILANRIERAAVWLAHGAMAVRSEPTRRGIMADAANHFMVVAGLRNAILIGSQREDKQ